MPEQSRPCFFDTCTLSFIYEFVLCRNWVERMASITSWDTIKERLNFFKSFTCLHHKPHLLMIHCITFDDLGKWFTLLFN